MKSTLPFFLEKAKLATSLSVYGEMEAVVSERGSGSQEKLLKIVAIVADFGAKSPVAEWAIRKRELVEFGVVDSDRLGIGCTGSQDSI